MCFPKSKKQILKKQILKKTDIKKIENTRIGGENNKGISGGERKRLCIGVELITSPSLLFLDEPTTGLDSITALKIVKLLYYLTKKG